MKLLKFVPIQLTFFLVIGILLGHFLNTGIVAPLVSTSTCFGILTFLFLSKNSAFSFLYKWAVGFTVVGIGMLAIGLSKPENFPSHYTHQNLTKQPTWQLKITSILKPTPYSQRFLADIKTVDGNSTTGSVLLNLPQDSMGPTLQVDDEFWAISALHRISAPKNPHQFDYKSHMASLGITHQLHLKTDEYYKSKHGPETIFGYAARLRNHIKSKLNAAPFGSKERGIIQALLLGERNDISASVYNDYKNAGAVHILAVSGLHIGILLLLFQFLLQPLKRLPKGKTMHLMVTVLLLWAFAFLAGLSASVVRAVTMFSFVAYALYLNRPSNTFNILALSMLFILLVFDPKLLFQVGFQMSYAAVIAIVWLYPVLQKKWYPKNRIIRKIWQLLSVSIAAQLGVLPISLFYFHQFPGLFFVSNLLVVPFLGVILGLGILVIVLSLLNLLPPVIATVYNSLIGWMNQLIGWVAEQEAFLFKNIPFDQMQVLLAYFIIFGLIAVLSKVTFRRTAMLLGAVVLFQSWLFYTFYDTSRKERLWLAHQTRNTIVIHQKGLQLTLMAKDGAASERIVTDYRVAKRIDSIRRKSIKNSLRWNDQNILIVDSLGVYIPSATKVDYLILTESPRLNLDRLIDSIAPKAIIADGSNYRNLIARWKQTCHKRKLPFHDTGEMGAYFFRKKMSD